MKKNVMVMNDPEQPRPRPSKDRTDPRLQIDLQHEGRVAEDHDVPMDDEEYKGLCKACGLHTTWKGAFYCCKNCMDSGAKSHGVWCTRCAPYGTLTHECRAIDVVIPQLVFEDEEINEPKPDHELIPVPTAFLNNSDRGPAAASRGPVPVPTAFFSHAKHESLNRKRTRPQRTRPTTEEPATQASQEPTQEPATRATTEPTQEPETQREE
jgi:hypothetical protein